MFTLNVLGFRMRRNRATLAIAVLTIVILAAAQAVAGTITYTESAVVSGSVGNTTFTNALLTMFLVGNTANVTRGYGFMSFTNNVGTFTFSIAGVGGGTFTNPMEVFVGQFNQGPAAGFSDGFSEGSGGLGTFDNVFGSYDLKTAIGPITNSSLEGGSLGTTLGTLNIQNVAANSTFTATTTTPEPVSLLLFGSGVLGLAGTIHRKLSR